MMPHTEKKAVQDGPGGTAKHADARAGTADDEACRCKETAAMTPRQLLDRMFDDLAFWKKKK